MKVNKALYTGVVILLFLALSVYAQDFTPTCGIELSNNNVGEPTEITFTFSQDYGELDCDSIYMTVDQGTVPYSEMTVGDIIGDGVSHMAGGIYTVEYELEVFSINVAENRASVQGIVTSSNHPELPAGFVVYHHEVEGNNTDIMVTTYADTADGNNWTMGVEDTTYFDELLILPHAAAIVFSFTCVSEPDNSSQVHYAEDEISVSLGVKESPAITPRTYSLAQNYPNPFNSSTSISYEIPVTSRVVLNIYNTEGRLVRTLVNGQATPGSHNVTWNGLSNAGNAVSTGVYIYRLQAGDFNAIQKMVYLK
ncbi:hypothetical protein AMJ86_08360 [bacterium SM23_57]|nr:MAG: hypothetical protein AMJ86_08360 [bacterium SM23_57]